MKRSIAKIAVIILSAIMAVSALAGCGAVNWKDKVTLNSPGEVKEETNGGFLVETDNYVYFINGEAGSSLDNSYGKPVKGSLAVAAKSDLTKSEIVVPKLFVAEDYSAGISIYGDSVYFVSPSTKKTTSNSTASGYADLCSAKLDGSGVTVYETVPSSSLQYRIVRSGDAVYFVYEDSSSKALYSFNTVSKEKTLITDSYTVVFFPETSVCDTVAVFYTTQSEKAYSTETYSYNFIHAYSIAGGDKVVLNGNASGADVTYALIASQNGYIYYSAVNNSISDTSLQTKHYAITVADLYAGSAATLLNSASASNVAESTWFVSPSEIYYVETDENEEDDITAFVICDSLVSTVAGSEKNIVAAGDPATIVSVGDDAILYIDSNGNLLRYNRYLSRQEIVTEDTVLSDWYAPEKVGNNIFYVNTSTEGCNYVYSLDLTSTVSERENADDDTRTEYYIDKSLQVAMGVVSESDQTLIVNNLIKGLSDSIVFDTDDDGNVILTDGEPSCEAVDTVSKRYDALSGGQKKNVSDEDKKTLENYREALRVSKLLYKLFGFDDITKNKDDFKTDYLAAKTVVDDLRVKAANDDENATLILSKLVQNGRWYLQQCEKYFTETAE